MSAFQESLLRRKSHYRMAFSALCRRPNQRIWPRYKYFLDARGRFAFTHI